MREFVDYAGCIHIHSRYSDGSFTCEEILADAHAAGLDFVWLTDHDTLKARHDGWQGWHQKVLCVAGVEIATRHGHIIAANIDECKGLRELPIERALARIAEQGGTAIAAHPMGKVKRLFHIKVGEWEAWESAHYAGFELWCYMHDWIHDLGVRNFLRFVRNPDTAIRGPESELLNVWDRVTQERPLTAIGALDNHARNIPFHRFGKPLCTILPHAYVFRTVRTHVLCESLSGDADSDVACILRAITRGRCYVSYELKTNARGFLFRAFRGANALHMGDVVTAGDAVQFEVVTPRRSHITLLCDGHPVASARGDTLSWELAAGRSGVVRAEARLDGRPWIFSNPIYGREFLQADEARSNDGVALAR